MNNIIEHIAFVNEQVAFHETRVEMYEKNKQRKNKHLQTLKSFFSLRDLLSNIENQSSSTPEQLTLSLRPEDLDGLPDELVAELSITSADKAEFLIASLMKEAGGVMSLDQVLVSYYKSTGEIVKRAAMTNRMYRMAQKGLVHSVPEKKGIYSTNPAPESESETIRMINESEVGKPNAENG